MSVALKHKRMAEHAYSPDLLRPGQGPGSANRVCAKFEKTLQSPGITKKAACAVFLVVLPGARYERTSTCDWKRMAEPLSLR